MAIIPSNEQFIGLSASLNTTEKRSALVNAESQAYTMQDIVDTVGSALPPAVNPTDQYVPLNFGGELADSPFSAAIASAGYYGWPTLSTQVGQIVSLPPGVDQSNVAPYLPYYGLRVQNHPILGQQTILGSYSGAGELYLSVIGQYSMSPSVENSLYMSPTAPGINGPLLVKGDGTLVQIGQQPNFNNTNIASGIIIDGNNGFMKINTNFGSPNNGIISVDNNTGLAIMGILPQRSVGFSAFNSAFHVGTDLMDNTPPANPTTPVTWVWVTDEANTTYRMPLYQ